MNRNEGNLENLYQIKKDNSSDRKMYHHIIPQKINLFPEEPVPEQVHQFVSKQWVRVVQPNGQVRQVRKLNYHLHKLGNSPHSKSKSPKLPRVSEQQYSGTMDIKGNVLNDQQLPEIYKNQGYLPSIAPNVHHPPALHRA